MAYSEDASADDLGRAFAALLKSARAGPDLAELWRAFSELQARERARLQDQRAHEDGGAFFEEAARGAEWEREKPFPGDPVVFMTRIHAALLASRLQSGLRWQRLVSQQLPKIRRRLDEYRAEEDPPPQLRRQLIDEVRELLRAIGEFAVEQGEEVQRRLDQLDRELIPSQPQAKNGGNGPWPRMAKAKGDPAEGGER
jgi:hypothetical protein